MAAMARLCVLAMLLLEQGFTNCAWSQGADAFDHKALAKRALEDHIRPGYRRFVDSAVATERALTAYCRAPSPQVRKSVDDAFDGLVAAWGRIEHIDFGPITKGQRLERIMLWPDRRGIAARQLANAVRSRDPDMTAPGKLAEKSVALQGLPALEILVFATGEPDAASHRCRFAEAVAANLARIATAIADEWADPDGYTASWLEPGPANTAFLRPVETTVALAKALDRGLEKVRDMRIGGPIGFNPQRRKIPAALGLSGRAMLLIASNIDGLRHLHEEGGMGAAIVAAAATTGPKDAVALTDLVAKEIGTAKAAADALVRLPTPFSEPRNVGRLVALGFPLKNARAVSRSLLEATAKVPMGFNASDGD